jgi:ankyrin repeat protein
MGAIARTRDELFGAIEAAALNSAAQNGNDEEVGLLLARGADPRAANDAGETPADLADAAGHDELPERVRAAQPPP